MTCCILPSAQILKDSAVCANSAPKAVIAYSTRMTLFSWIVREIKPSRSRILTFCESTLGEIPSKLFLVH